MHKPQMEPDETTLPDSMIYCYGVDVHPAALGGGPTEVTPPGELQIEYRINGVTVSTATLTPGARRALSSRRPASVPAPISALLSP